MQPCIFSQANNLNQYSTVKITQASKDKIMPNFNLQTKIKSKRKHFPNKHHIKLHLAHPTTYPNPNTNLHLTSPHIKFHRRHPHHSTKPNLLPHHTHLLHQYHTLTCSPNTNLLPSLNQSTNLSHTHNLYTNPCPVASPQYPSKSSCKFQPSLAPNTLPSFNKHFPNPNQLNNIQQSIQIKATFNLKQMPPISHPNNLNHSHRHKFNDNPNLIQANPSLHSTTRHKIKSLQTVRRWSYFSN